MADRLLPAGLLLLLGQTAQALGPAAQPSWVVWSVAAFGAALEPIGPGVKAGYASNTKYDHGSLVKSVEEIFNLPILPTVAGKNNFADLFKPGSYP